MWCEPDQQPICTQTLQPLEILTAQQSGGNTGQKMPLVGSSRLPGSTASAGSSPGLVETLLGLDASGLCGKSAGADSTPHAMINAAPRPRSQEIRCMVLPFRAGCVRCPASARPGSWRHSSNAVPGTGPHRWSELLHPRLYTARCSSQTAMGRACDADGRRGRCRVIDSRRSTVMMCSRTRQCGRAPPSAATHRGVRRVHRRQERQPHPDDLDVGDVLAVASLRDKRLHSADRPIGRRGTTMIVARGYGHGPGGRVDGPVTGPLKLIRGPGRPAHSPSPCADVPFRI